MPVDPPRPPEFPLNALRAFEAAARLGGFAAAAAELGVSPGAITAHVKGLEARLGAPLFERRARGVALTALGRSVLPGLTGAFDQLGTVQTLLRVAAQPDRLSIATLPAIAQLWLQPRLAALEATMPGLRVSIDAREGPPPHKRAAHDLWLFFGPGGRDALVPVRKPGAEGPRLTDSAWAADWDLWEAATGADGAEGPVFSLYAVAIEEALRGAGTAMGRLSLVAPLIATGRLEEAGPRVALPEGLEITVAHPGRIARLAANWLRAQIAGG
ncbi:LysR family transcriptional regulator [Jannaschia ovalis]|uniref:LysR family transcriptional regulator n=1 Tax=Jannaschia ovalis TaxID=3038773 RepID=A0ABY8LGX9_9RHOB|nr:LysR family transcriptional regulator [Jannaschia sp. GRR-S6-38]WGH79668.1 LysR family transcriptional regulator [Jannaschia sp. GRR-S6-38]